MKCSISIQLALSAILIGAPFSGGSEDLDAALEAKKKKARRHVYSERALIEYRNIVIPKALSEAEKTLDRDLEKLESQLTRQVLPPRGAAPSRILRPSPEKTDNWLTPTLLDSEDGEDLSSEKNVPGWINQELDRQKEIQLHKKALAEEEALVNKLLRENSRNKTSTEKSSIQSYEPMLRNTISPSLIQPVSKSIVPDPLGILRPKEGAGPSTTAPLFSPTALHNSGVIQPSFSSLPSSPSSIQTPSWRPHLGSSAQKAPSGFTSNLDATKPKPLSPLKRVRQSLPIHRKDPFANDFMPEIKTSIWD